MAVTPGDIGMAAIVGWTLGSPHVGRTTYRRLSGYEPVPHQMAPGAALDAWWAIEWHLQQGRKPHELVSTYLQHWESLERETAIARFNRASGPASGSWGNPWADGSEGLTRAIFYGAIGGEVKVAPYLWAIYDSHFDHIQRDVFSANCAHWVSGRSTDLDFEHLGQVELEIADIVINTLRTDGPEKVHERVLEKTAGLSPFSARRSFAWIVAGVIAGNGDFSRSVLTTASFGGATNHTTAVTAAILAAAGSGPTDEWKKPLGNTYVATTCLTSLDAPKSLEEVRIRLNAIPALSLPDTSAAEFESAFSLPPTASIWIWSISEALSHSEPHQANASTFAQTCHFLCTPGRYRLVTEGGPVKVNGKPATDTIETDGKLVIEVGPYPYTTAIVVLDEEGRVVPLDCVIVPPA